MEKEFSRITGPWNNKSELEKTIAAGVYGTPELKPDEKSAFLGEFKERVLQALTKAQVAEDAVYVEIVQALQDKRAARLIYSGDIDYRYVDKYVRLSRKYGKPYTIRHDQKYKSDIGLLVVSKEAVDAGAVVAVNREERLTRLGLPLPVIKAAPGKVCDQCYALIEQAAPEETMNYERLTFFDRLAGEKCPAHPD